MIGGGLLGRVRGPLLLFLAAMLPVLFLSPLMAQTDSNVADRTYTAVFVAEGRSSPDGENAKVPAGFEQDVLRDVAALAGIDIEVRIAVSLDAAMGRMAAGEVDLISDIPITADGARVGLYTAPVETAAISVFVRRDAPQFGSFEALRGKRVGVVWSSSGLDLVTKLGGAIPVLRRDIRTAIVDLVAGQLDAVIYSKAKLQRVLRQFDFEDRVRALNPPLQETKRGILVAKREAELWMTLDSAVRRYVGTEAYEHVYRKWYGGGPEFWTAGRVAWLMGGLALLGLMASFGWRYFSVATLNRQLTEQTAIARSVLENADQGFTLFDADMNLVAYNDRFFELLDFPRELAPAGAPFEGFIRYAAERGDLGPGELEEVVRRHVAAARRSEPRNFLRPGRNGRTLDVRGTPIPEGGFVTTFTDITEQMRVEGALRISEQQLSEAQRIGRIGHWRYLIDTRRFECSDAFYRIYGWDPAEFTATFSAISDAVHPDDRERVHGIRKDAGKRKAAYRCQFRIIRNDGEVRFVRGEGRPEFDDNGKLVSFFGVNQDVTEQKQAEEELLRERTRAELANRAKSEFLANMSHEIRTPLNAIIGFADIIRREVFGSVANERYAEYIGDIHASAEHLLDLVNDILDISTIEAGEMSLSPVELDLGSLFDECARVVREQARLAQIQLTIAAPDPNIPVYADRRAVRQILLNLLSNAIKFTPPEGQVSVGVELAEDVFAILVTDTGVGIPREHLGTITQPFETGSDDPHTSSKGNPYVRSKGTGLGLAIVRSLANLHGGDVRIQSEEGIGTTVRVSIPRRRRDVAA